MNQKINLDLSDVKNVECELEKCSSHVFTPVFVIKHVSALISPTGQETFVPVQVFMCAECGHINEKFLEGLTN